MNINFSELKGLSEYNFKRDKDLKLIVKNITKKDVDMNKVYFVLCNGDGEAVYQSKKGCFEIVDYKKRIKTGKLLINRYTYVDAKKLSFKSDKRGYSQDLHQVRDFCNNRKSGREIYDYVMQFMYEYSRNYLQEFIPDPNVKAYEPKHSSNQLQIL